MKVLKISLLMLVLGVFLVACGGNTKPRTEIDLDMTDFSYSMLSVTIPAGQPVTIRLKNKGLIEHDFVIEKIDAIAVPILDSGSDAHHAHGQESKFDVHASAQAGETTVLELTVSEPGTYQFYCSVEGHKEAGMIGELLVIAEQ